MKVKYYNSIVSNFEEGDVQENIGAHLDEYIGCQKDYLKKDFTYPDV